jgi:hypothetical protein
MFSDMGAVDAELEPMIGRAELSPDLFQFEFVDIEAVGQQSVVITNRGTAPMALTDFSPAFGVDYTLYWHLGVGDIPLNEQEVGALMGRNQMPESIDLAVAESVTITLVYRPTIDGIRGGQFVLQADREIRIPIEHSDDRPEFVAEPVEVLLDEVPLTERRLGILSVRNVGTAIATLASVVFEGDAEFTISIEGQDPEVDTRALHNPDRDLEPGVGIDKTFEVIIRFSSEEEGEFQGLIRILSDAVNGELVVPVIARTVTEDTP